MAEASVNRSGGRGSDRLLLWVEGLAGFAVVLALIGKSYGPAPTVFFILAAGATAFAGWTLWRAYASWSDETLDVVGHVRDLERERLEQEKLIILKGIKELESDLAIGKVDPADYVHLRQTAERRALAIIQKLKDDDRRWRREAEDLVRNRLGDASPILPRPAPAEDPLAAADRQPAHPALFDARPAAWSAEHACSACGAQNEAEGAFCTGCGRPRQGGAR